MYDSSNGRFPRAFVEIPCATNVACAVPRPRPAGCQPTHIQSQLPSLSLTLCNTYVRTRLLDTARSRLRQTGLPRVSTEATQSRYSPVPNSNPPQQQPSRWWYSTTPLRAESTQTILASWCHSPRPLSVVYRQPRARPARSAKRSPAQTRKQTTKQTNKVWIDPSLALAMCPQAAPSPWKP